MPYQVEKTVFISYRRTNIFHARAIFQNLRANGYDVFMDYESIDSGAFDQIILNQIKARAHFLVLLTPSALERCSEPGDWLRREIETAIEEKRNIVPLYFEGFDFADVQKYLPPHLHVLGTYNALRIPSDYFDEAMSRLRDRFLNKPLEMILHPTPADHKPIVEQTISQQATEPAIVEEELTASEYFERGFSAHQMGDLETAIQDYTKALHLNPSNARAFNNRGGAYNILGQNKQAIDDYNQAIALDPNYAPAYSNRGKAYRESDDIQQALADYDAALSLDPHYAQAYYNRAIAYYKLGQYAQSLADYEAAIQYNPQDADSHFGAALACDKIGDRSQEIAHYEACLEIDPGYENARSNLEIAKRQQERGE